MNFVPYTIDQVAQLVGVTKSALRYWEGVYGVRPERNEGNHRRYSQEQVELLLRIKSLMDEGYAVRGIKARLPESAGVSAS
jgi:DNA-binding transcriptional MerR regulator